VDATRLDDAMRQQVTEVIDPNTTEPFGVYAWADPNPAASLARHVERVVFDEAFGNSADQLDVEYGKYERSSLFFCVIDHHRRIPVGIARAILPSDAGLKSLNDIEREWGENLDDVFARTGLHMQPELAWDYATVATLSDYRGGDTHGVISMALYQTFATATIRCGFRWVVAVIDVPVLRLLQWRLSRVFETYEGVAALPYLGSAASMPVWSDLPAYRARLATSNPDTHDIVFGGHGLPGSVAPPDWDAVEELIGGCAARRLVRESEPPATPLRTPA
jgi:hypothetical protein